MLATKAELAEIGDIDAEMFTSVDYKVETRAGKIALSNEVGRFSSEYCTRGQRSVSEIGRKH